MAVSKYEIKAKKELEAEGWRVDDKRGMGRFAKNRDFFNLFDLVAIKKGQAIRWISIKGVAGIPRSHRQQIQEFWLPENNIKEAWNWRKGKKIKGWNRIIL